MCYSGCHDIPLKWVVYVVAELPPLKSPVELHIAPQSALLYYFTLSNSTQFYSSRAEPLHSMF
jgi:hypothetical protein